MIKAYLPPEKSVYSLPRAAPGSPKPSRPHIPVRQPGHYPRSKAIRPGQGILPGTNIDRER